jgi:hypothetical protein
MAIPGFPKYRSLSGNAAIDIFFFDEHMWQARGTHTPHLAKEPTHQTPRGARAPTLVKAHIPSLAPRLT